MGKATASMSKIIDRKNGSRRVASRVNLAGLFKARKKVRKPFRVALATPEFTIVQPSLTRTSNVWRLGQSHKPGAHTNRVIIFFL